MKKMFLFLALLSYFTAYPQLPYTDAYTIHNIDGREYKKVDFETAIIFYRTSTWQVETSKTHLNGEYFTNDEAYDLIKFKNVPPANFDTKMNQIYAQVLSIPEREAMIGDELTINFFLNTETGDVTATEFQISSIGAKRFIKLPLEKWAKMDKLIMDAGFKFTIPPERKDANYQTSHWFKEGEDKVSRERIYIYGGYYNPSSNENINGSAWLPASSPVNGDLSIYTENPTTIVISSASKGFKIYLRQCNYDLGKLAQIRDVTSRDAIRFTQGTMSNSMFSYNQRGEYYTLEKILSMTKAEAWAWAERMKDKDIVVIDQYTSGSGSNGTHKTWRIRDIWTNKP